MQEYLQFDESPPLETQAMVEAVAKSWRLYQPGRQEDAHEFLITLLQTFLRCGLGRNFNGKKSLEEKSVIFKLFGGQLRSQVKCLRCKQESNTIDAFFSIPLDITGAGKVSFSDCLHRYCGKEILKEKNKYHCTTCLSPQEAEKQLTIDSPPRILIIHLMRFDQYGFKIGRYVDFPETLNVGGLLSSH